MIKHQRNIVYPLGEIFLKQNEFLFKVSNHLDNFSAINCTVKLELCHMIKVSIPQKSEHHFHPFYELTHVIDGEIFQQCDNTNFKLQKGSTFCIPPGTNHQWYSKGRNLKLIGFMLSIIPNNQEGYLLNERLKQGIIKNGYRVKCSKKMLSYLDELYINVENFDKDMAIEISSHAIHGYLIELIKALLIKESNLKNAAVFKHQINPIILKAKSIIQLRLGECVSLEDVSNELELSKQHLNRLFKQAEEITLGEYILQQRLAKAKSLLTLSSVLSISEISKLIGFQDSNYFSQFFKKRTGMRPQDYRATSQ